MQNVHKGILGKPKPRLYFHITSSCWTTCIEENDIHCEEPEMASQLTCWRWLKYMYLQQQTMVDLKCIYKTTVFSQIGDLQGS